MCGIVTILWLGYGPPGNNIPSGEWAEANYKAGCTTDCMYKRRRWQLIRHTIVNWPAGTERSESSHAEILPIFMSHLTVIIRTIYFGIVWNLIHYVIMIIWASESATSRAADQTGRSSSRMCNKGHCRVSIIYETPCEILLRSHPQSTRRRHKLYSPRLCNEELQWHIFMIIIS